MATPMQRATSNPPPTTIPMHPPAQKVGGRRLSLTSRSRPHHLNEHKAATPPEDDDDTPADYPRPAAPGQQALNEEHHHHEEEQARRDHKHGQGAEHERKVQESLHQKAEQNRPSKEPFSKAPISRVNQPARQMNL